MIPEDRKELSEINLSTKARTPCTQTCSKCGSTKIIYDPENAEIVCMYCGFVTQEEIVDKRVKGKTDYKQDIETIRSGRPLTYTIHDKGLSTIIDPHDISVYGKNFSSGQKNQAYRLCKWQRRIRITDSTERNLAFALSEITKMSNKLNLSKDILETATAIYKRAVKERVTIRHSIQSVAVAALYLACRQCKLTRTLDEIVQTSTVSKKKAGKSYWDLIKNLEYTTTPLQPDQYITKFSNKIITQEKTQEVTHKILSAAKEAKLTSGHAPIDIAAAAYYAALVLTGEHNTWKEVAEIAHTTEATIRNRYKEFEKYLEIEISI